MEVKEVKLLKASLEAVKPDLFKKMTNVVGYLRVKKSELEVKLEELARTDYDSSGIDKIEVVAECINQIDSIFKAVDILAMSGTDMEAYSLEDIYYGDDSYVVEVIASIEIILKGLEND